MRRVARLTFGIDPVGVQVGQGSLVADLLQRLLRLVVDLEDAARSPPAARVGVCHGPVGTASARRMGGRVVGDGALEEDWGRQFGGIDNGDAFGFDTLSGLFVWWRWCGRLAALRRGRR